MRLRRPQRLRIQGRASRRLFGGHVRTHTDLAKGLRQNDCGWVGWSVGRLAGRLAGWLVGRSIGVVVVVVIVVVAVVDAAAGIVVVVG